VETVDRAVALASRVGAEAVLSVGGGSTTGTAKAIALRTSLPIVAVPTTYAGSEVTPVWGTTEGARKTTGRSPLVVPKAVLYDPALTRSLPAALTAVSAMNAMAHCVEAFYAPGANPVTELVAAEGVRVIAGTLPTVVAEPGDEAARAGLLYGAYLAGSAFAAAGSGLHHRICHVLGGAFGLPHAETHTVLLPHVAAFNEPAVPALRTRVAPALGGGDVAAGLTRLAAGIGAPVSLAEIGLSPAALDLAVELVLEKDLSDNPRPVGEPEVRRILTGALHGRLPAPTEEDRHDGAAG
jgi:alcohol dehydrogenase class IV